MKEWNLCGLLHAMWPLSVGKITQRTISKKLSGGGGSRQELQIVCSRGARHVWHVLYHAITNTSLNRLVIQVLWVGTPPPEIKCLWPLHWLSLCVCSSSISYVSPYSSFFFFSQRLPSVVTPWFLPLVLHKDTRDRTTVVTGQTVKISMGETVT
jgi:hypothetical protein